MKPNGTVLGLKTAELYKLLVEEGDSSLLSQELTTVLSRLLAQICDRFCNFTETYQCFSELPVEPISTSIRNTLASVLIKKSELPEQVARVILNPDVLDYLFARKAVRTKVLKLFGKMSDSEIRGNYLNLTIISEDQERAMRFIRECID